jgi:hypothetical protein
MSWGLLPQQVIPQLAFLAPNRLLILLIIPLLILAYIFASLARTVAACGLQYLNARCGRAQAVSMARHLAVALSLLSLITLRPPSLARRLRSTCRGSAPPGRLVIDASHRCRQRCEPTRLDAAKQAAIDFVNKLPEKYNVSVVSMAGRISDLGPANDRAQHRWRTRSTASNCRTRPRSARGSRQRYVLCSKLRRIQQPELDRSGRHRAAERRLEYRGRSPQQAAA